MIQSDVISITQKQTFVSYRNCEGLEEITDVLIDIPETPIPGAMFAGEFFLPQSWQEKVRKMNTAFFVAGIEHSFKVGVQHVRIILAAAPRDLLHMDGGFRPPA